MPSLRRTPSFSPTPQHNTGGGALSQLLPGGTAPNYFDERRESGKAPAHAGNRQGHRQTDSFPPLAAPQRACAHDAGIKQTYPPGRKILA